MMKHTASLYDRHQNSLNNLKRQNHFITKYKLPLIIVKTNISFDINENNHDDLVYKIALQEVQNQLSALDATIVDQDTTQDKSNLESIFVIKGTTASHLKRAMTHIENSHPLGSLINIDVVTSQGLALSRKEAQMEPRKCLLCHSPASYCSSNHHHSDNEIKQKIRTMIEEYYPNKIAV